MEDWEYMRLALDLAKRGAGFISPNPLVGAVIVKDGCIIGEGWHERYGEPHAERNALKNCREVRHESPKGSTMYVTLEPCCHYGKQPPCVDAILEAEIARVVIGCGDPNPLVAGKGTAILRKHGLEVSEGVLVDECVALNKVFFHYIRTGMPYVTLKYAMTLDGKIAAHTGAAKWITGEAARRHVHEQRAISTAIMVGIGTVLADDPLLSCRLPDNPGAKNPTRIICDTKLRTPLNSQIVRTASEIPTIITTCCRDSERQAPYIHAGCRIIEAPQNDERLDLAALLKILGQTGIDSIILEGGGKLNWSALQAGLVQRVQTYIAPKLLGGETAPTPVGGLGFDRPDEGVQLENCVITRLGEDLLLEADVKAENESEVRTDVHRDC
jgi:diaminohydroxyphosphoribosylaminopyrimidine deaminase/5-amino-6-(5-phosphoribosylamino)uracil reductase